MPCSRTGQQARLKRPEGRCGAVRGGGAGSPASGRQVCGGHRAHDSRSRAMAGKGGGGGRRRRLVAVCGGHLLIGAPTERCWAYLAPPGGLTADLTGA